MNAQVQTAIEKSGAAGAATFAGSNSRKYNYYEPKGRKATHYEDMTVDVQPDPERYLLQDWIISFGDGKPAYSKDSTAAKSANWHLFRAVDQEWERTHYQRQSTICGMIQNLIDNGRKSGAAARLDKTWIKILQDHLGAYKHAEFGLGTSTMQAQRYGYTQMINNAVLTNSSYKLRFAQDLTLYLGELGLDIGPDLDIAAGKKHWLDDPIWQGTRKAIEAIMGATDYLEQYFATNLVFERLDDDPVRGLRGGFRPFHTLCPALVMGEAGVELAIATPGDHGQPQSLFQVMRRHFEQEVDIQSAIEWPRLRHDTGREVMLESRCPLSWDTALAQAGWAVKRVDSWSRVMGGVNAIRKDGALLMGGADPRRSSYAIAE